MLRHWLNGIVGIGLITLLALSTSQHTVQARNEDRPLFTRLIGSHTLLFMHMRIGDYLKIPMIKDTLEKMPEAQAQMEKGIREALGIGISDLDTATVYVDQPGMANGDIQEPRDPYFILQTKQPVQLDALKAAVGDSAKLVKFGKYDLHVGAKYAVSLLDSKALMIIAMADQRRETIQQDWLLHFACLDSENEIPDGLKESVTLAQGNKHTMVAGFHIPKELSTILQDKLKQAPAAMAPFKALAQVQSGIITLDYKSDSENDFQMRCRARFGEESQAKAGMGAI